MSPLPEAHELGTVVVSTDGKRIRIRARGESRELGRR